MRLDAAEARLEGYRVDERGRWVRWAADEGGRLWSAVLGLWLVLEDDEVRAQTASGEPLRTPLQLEQEVARLRAEVERLSRE